MFYLIMHSTHFIYGYMVSCHVVKDHSARKETCCCNYTVPLYASSHRHNVRQVMGNWLEWETAQSGHHEGLIPWSIAPWLDALPQSYISLLSVTGNLFKWHFACKMFKFYRLHLKEKWWDPNIISWLQIIKKCEFISFFMVMNHV